MMFVNKEIVLNESFVYNSQRYLNCSSSFQVLLYLSSVLIIEPGHFLVEPHVLVVNVVHIRIRSVGSLSPVLSPLINPAESLL